ERRIQRVVGWEDQARQESLEGGRPVVLDRLSGEPVSADAEAVVDLQDATEIHREAGARRFQRGIREISARRDPKGRKREVLSRYALGREIGPLMQLQAARDVREPESHLEPGMDLIRDGGLDVDRANVS